MLFLLSFLGLAYSFYPYVVPGQLSIWDAAASNDALAFVFWGAIIVIPAIISYTILAYRVFWGKVDELRYY